MNKTKLKIKITKFKTGSYYIELNKPVENQKEYNYLIKQIDKLYKGEKE